LIGQTALGEAATALGQTGRRYSRGRFHRHGVALCLMAPVLALWLAVPPAKGRERDGMQYGAALIVSVPMPESEVTQAVNEVVQNGIIRGTKEYNKDEYVTGATVATSTRAFPAWTEGGKVFYKIRAHALDPRNFKDSGDVGTLAVRYIVQGQDEKNTVLRIDAVFVEDFRRTVHASNGSVENAEYKDIRDRLEAMETMKAQSTEKERQQVSGKLLRKEQSPLASATQLAPSGPEHPPEILPQPAVAGPPDESPEQHLQNLRRQVERLVKSPGAPLKSSPFHTASTLSSLPPGTEVLILIATPYWYGVETREGQRGWISRDQLEPLP
jgi:hypothetical protein